MTNVGGRPKAMGAGEQALADVQVCEFAHVSITSDTSTTKPLSPIGRGRGEVLRGTREGPAVIGSATQR